jgi:putative transposase
VLRYVEANPLRANLAKRAREWTWSSCAVRKIRAGQFANLLDELPVPLPGDWEQIVQTRWEKGELESVRESMRRGRPFGSDQWVRATAKKLGLDFTLRPRGRPPKHGKAAAVPGK